MPIGETPDISNKDNMSADENCKDIQAADFCDANDTHSWEVLKDISVHEQWPNSQIDQIPQNSLDVMIFASGDQNKLSGFLSPRKTSIERSFGEKMEEDYLANLSTAHNSPDANGYKRSLKHMQHNAQNKEGDLSNTFSFDSYKNHNQRSVQFYIDFNDNSRSTVSFTNYLIEDDLSQIEKKSRANSEGFGSMQDLFANLQLQYQGQIQRQNVNDESSELVQNVVSPSAASLACKIENYAIQQNVLKAPYEECEKHVEAIYYVQPIVMALRNDPINILGVYEITNYYNADNQRSNVNINQDNVQEVGEANISHANIELAARASYTAQDNAQENSYNSNLQFDELSKMINAASPVELDAQTLSTDHAQSNENSDEPVESAAVPAISYVQSSAQNKFQEEITDIKRSTTSNEQNLASDYSEIYTAGAISASSVYLHQPYSAQQVEISSVFYTFETTHTYPLASHAEVSGQQLSNVTSTANLAIERLARNFLLQEINLPLQYLPLYLANSHLDCGYTINLISGYASSAEARHWVSGLGRRRIAGLQNHLTSIEQDISGS